MRTNTTHTPALPPACIIFHPQTMFVCNHSGGKDSQAMFLYLSKFVPKEQFFVIYSDLGEVEWEGSKEHIESTIFN